MFKFLSGVAVGWTMARLLPPAHKDQAPWQPPSSSELLILAQHATRAVEHVKKTLESETDD